MSISHYVLFYNHPEIGEQRFRLVVGTVYRIGSKNDNDIVIAQKDVSRHHAMLKVLDGTFHITDLNSKNGTLLNGKQIADTDFRCGDQIDISSVRLQVLEVGSSSYIDAPEIRPAEKGKAESNDHHDVTVGYRDQATIEDMVDLLEVTSAAVRRGAISDPLRWAIENFGLEGALVLYRDALDNVAMVASAGNVGPMVTGGETLSRLVREQDEGRKGGPTLCHVRELGEELLVAPLRMGHVLVVRFLGHPPAVVDLRSLMASVGAVLESTASRPEARPTAIALKPYRRTASDSSTDVSQDALMYEPQLSAELLALPLDEARQTFERWMVKGVIDSCAGNQTSAAEKLGVSRAGLFKILKRLGLSRNDK